MDRLNRAIILLGSNQECDMNMECAAIELEAHFAVIHFSEPVYTRYIGDFQNVEPSLNQVAIGYTTEDPGTLRELFKEIEQLLGRDPEDKTIHNVPIDIDLLLWNCQTFKPENIKRDYVVSGIRSLLSKSI